MRKLSKLTCTGIACMATGFFLVGGWSVWMRTRSTRPVNMPMVLKASHLRSPEFQVNLDHLYTIGIEASESFQQETLPFDKLNCLMGIHSFVNQPVFDLITPGKMDCDNTPPITANWVVTSGPSIVARGTSSESELGLFSENKITRVIGSFHSEKGRRYVLDTDFKNDMDRLAPTNPHLVIKVGTDFYEQNLLIGELLILLCAILVSIGAILLIVAAFRYWRKRKQFLPVGPPCERTASINSSV
ncbi:MAG TPA: hypothetical protein VG498_02840 [Terriglobales bacterium]|nr:hypothetical protein [Terriglobales bacterium]